MRISAAVGVYPEDILDNGTPFPLGDDGPVPEEFDYLYICIR